MTKADREALDRALETCQKVLDGTAVTHVETVEERAERKRRLLSDYNAFTRYYFPHYATCDCAPFHVALAEAVRDNPRFYGQAEWPRGHAKTTHLVIVLPMWLMAQGQIHVGVLVGKSWEKAADALADLQNELATNERYAADFGEQYNPTTWKTGEFVTRQGVAFTAFGLNQSPRGLRERQHRPDYILVDDIDDETWMHNPARVTKYVQKLEGAVYGTMDMGRGRFLMSGNRIHPDAVVARFAKKAGRQPGYHYSRVEALVHLPDGTRQAAWPAKYTVAEIEETMAKMDPRIAQAEYMNAPSYGGGSFHERHLKWAHRALGEKADARIVYIDPSYKPSKEGDFKAAMVLSRRGETYHLHDLFLQKCDLGVLIQWCYAINAELRAAAGHWPFFIEGELSQQSLLINFAAYGKEHGLALPISPDTRKKVNKARRIADMVRLFEQGQVSFEEELRHTPRMEELVRQLLGFTGSRTMPDDGPDALEGGISMVRCMSSGGSLIVASGPGRHVSRVQRGFTRKRHFA